MDTVMGVRRWRAGLVAFLLVGTLGAARAHAAEPAIALLVPAGVRAEIGRELRVAMAERGARVLAGEAPWGDSALERAADAQASARRMGAVAAVWAESGVSGAELHAVGTAGSQVRHAPLPGPIEALAPRVVATVAASLVDELLAAELTTRRAAATVTVRVETGIDAAPAPLPASAPSFAPAPARWTLAVGAFHGSDSSGLELHVNRRVLASGKLGVWGTLGRMRSDGGWAISWLGFAISGSAGDAAGVSLEYGVFAAASLAGTHTSDALDMAYTAGVGGTLLGARVGLGFPVNPEWRLRLDASGALATFYGKGTIPGWLSVLLECRL